MAMTALERKRASRDRQKAARDAAPDQTADIVARPVSQSLAAYLVDAEFPFEEGLDALGVHIDGLLGDDVQRFRSDGLGEITMPGLERLEGLAGAFLDATKELHVMLNSFKSQEAQDRLAELEDRELPNAEARREAMAQAVKLNSILAALKKSTRHDFPVIEVKEVKR